MAFSNHFTDFNDFVRLFHDKMLRNSDFFEETFIQMFNNNLKQSEMRLFTFQSLFNH